MRFITGGAEPHYIVVSRLAEVSCRRSSVSGLKQRVWSICPRFDRFLHQAQNVMKNSSPWLYLLNSVVLLILVSGSAGAGHSTQAAAVLDAAQAATPQSPRRPPVPLRPVTRFSVRNDVSPPLRSITSSLSKSEGLHEIPLWRLVNRGKATANDLQTLDLDPIVQDQSAMATCRPPLRASRASTTGMASSPPAPTGMSAPTIMSR